MTGPLLQKSSRPFLEWLLPHASFVSCTALAEAWLLVADGLENKREEGALVYVVEKFRW